MSGVALNLERSSPYFIFIVTLVDVFGAFGLTVSEKSPGNYELADPACHRNANSIHHNEATIPSDEFLCLPWGRDYGKFEFVSRD